MLNKNESVSLSKGQSPGESSPSSSVLKNIMSLRSVQNGVSPDYVSKSCADNSTDSILNKPQIRNYAPNMIQKRK